MISLTVGSPCISLFTFGDFSQVFPLHIVVGFHKDFTETRLTNRVILEIEFVKAMERVLVSLDR